MIVIRSSSQDISTRQIIDYLCYYKAPFLLITDDQKIDGLKITINVKSQTLFLFFEKTNTSISSESISSYYYRRGAFNYADLWETSKSKKESFQKNVVVPYLTQELKITDRCINEILEKTPVKIGAFSKVLLEKPSQLFAASKAGLEIPDTYICTHKADVVALLDQYSLLSTKGIQSNFYFFSKNDKRSFVMYNSIFSVAELDQIPEVFFPTLFQEYVNKKYELRIFYLHKKCYSMAIFSQTKEKTRVDFRHYDDKEPTRTVPFNLPKIISDKIISLMDSLSLDTGSIDLIVTNDDRYVFLEVNPDGQFGMISFPCNFFLEKEIAKTLARL